jgi:hypothetical protein
VKSVEKYCPQRQTCSDCMENHQLPQVCSFGTGSLSRGQVVLIFMAQKLFSCHLSAPHLLITIQCSYHFLKPVREVGVIFKKPASLLFDHPLFFKARDIVEGGQHSELSCVVVRLGEFHFLMSFMGCTGAIMARSCLKALFMTIYTDRRRGQDAE